MSTHTHLSISLAGLIAAAFFLCFPTTSTAVLNPAALKSEAGLKIIPPGAGHVMLEQVEFDFEAGRVVDSDWGRIKVKFPSAGEDCSGYINVFLQDDGRGAEPFNWVVENMHVPPPTHCPGGCGDSEHHSEVAGGKPEDHRHDYPMTRFFDLRPNEVGSGPVRELRGAIVLSEKPLPNSDEVWSRLIPHLPMKSYPVMPAFYNAEGDLGAVRCDPANDLDEQCTPSEFPPESDTYHLVGLPPPPTFPPSSPQLDLAAAIEVFQDTWPNIEAGINQCVPMAHANAFRYLETQFNILPLQWDLPHWAFRGLGIVGNAGDVLFWTAVPDYSVIAQIDQRTKRAGVHDFDTGDGSSRCQNIRGALSYIHDALGDGRAFFRHQGGAAMYKKGDGNGCSDYLPENIGAYESNREGLVPTWQWIFDQLVAGRSVVISYGRYDSNGERTGGHMLRIYGAAMYSGKTYLYALDDGIQGDNFVGTQLQTFEVADTENSGAGGDGGTDNMLNIDGKSWEIEFALSTQAMPILMIP